MRQKKIDPYPIKLGKHHHQEFQKNGFLAFSSFLENSEIQQISTLLNKTVSEFHTNIINNDPSVELVSQFVSNQKLVSVKKIESSAQIQFEPNFDPIKTLTNARVRKIQSLSHCNQWFQGPEYKYRMINGVSQLLGDAPVLYDEMAMLKPQNGGMEVPLHQDSAYMSFYPAESIIGVWIAIDTALQENSCLVVIPETHKCGPLPHTIGKSKYKNRYYNHTETVVVYDGVIEPSQYGKEKFIELEAGGIIFFSGLLLHGSYKNYSSVERRSLQYHFRTCDSQVLSKTEYVLKYPEFFKHK